MNNPSAKRSSLPSAEWIRSLCLLMLFCCFLCLSSRSFADLTLTLDTKDGDTISDTARIVAHVVSDALVLKVEFKVDEMDRFTGSSTPYIYIWDTIADTGGAHKLTVTATDAIGKTKTTTIAVTVDNEIGTGAPALTEKARAAVTANDYDAAFRYARRALKADPNAVEAVRALARGYVAQKKFDEAIEALEGLKNLAASATALNDAADYRLQRALLPKNFDAIVTEFPTIADLRHKAAEIEVKQAAAQSGTAAGDALLKAGRFEDAQKQYGNTGEFTNVSLEVLADILGGHQREGAARLRARIQDHKSTIADRAVFGLAMLLNHDAQTARNMVAQDLRTRVPASLIVAAYADAALGKKEDSKMEATAAAKLAPTAPETLYALSMTAEPEAAQRYLATAIGEAPYLTGPYLDLALLKAFGKGSDRNTQAFKLISQAQKLDPDNINAKLIEILLYLQAKQTAIPALTLKDLARQYPNTPDILMTLSIYYQTLNQEANASKYLDAVNRIDSEHVGRSVTEQPLEFLKRVNREVHYRTGFFLTPQTLVVPKTDTASNP